MMLRKIDGGSGGDTFRRYNLTFWKGLGHTQHVSFPPNIMLKLISNT